MLKRWMRLSSWFLAAASVASCQRCGGASDPGASPSAMAPSGSAIATAIASATVAPAGGEVPQVPEIKDDGPGRATAALRAALSANGITFDAEAITRACKVDDDGASIDDLEDVADANGLEVRQIIVPREHVLLPQASLLPGIVILEVPGDADALDFVLVWKLDGDRVLVMDPVEGKHWVSRSDLTKRIWVHEMTIAAEDWHAAETDPSYQSALRARIEGIGGDGEKARALLDRASADPASRGLAAIDAAIRVVEGDPSKASGDPIGFLTKALDCAIDKRCAGEPIAPAAWSSKAAPKAADGTAEVSVRGAVMLTIIGKKAPAP